MDPEDAAKVGASWTGADLLASGGDGTVAVAVTVESLSLSAHAAAKLAAAQAGITNWAEESRMW